MGRENKSSSSTSKRKASSYPNKKGDENKKSSKIQKRELKQERQSHRKHAESVTEAKAIWNKLRLKNNPPDQVRKLMENLMKLIQGKAVEIALQHDASRVLQAAIQFGTKEERLELLTELCQPNTTTLFELSKNQYSHFLVLKIIKYCARYNDCVQIIVKTLKVHMPKLGVHAVGSRVVESLFTNFPAKSTTVLKQGFYGPHFALFTSDSSQGFKSLESHLKSAPEKKDTTLNSIRTFLHKGIEKSFFGYSYYQELFAEWVDLASPNDIRSMAPSVADHCIHLLSSREGTRVVVAIASYGTTKDRKRIIKSLKGYTRSALLHRDAYLAILRICSVTDDTVSVHKNIFNELLTIPDDEKTNADEDESPLLNIALNDRACKLFLMLLISDESQRGQKLFDPYESSVLNNSKPSVIKDEKTGQEVPTSRKDSNVRQKELLKFLRDPLIELCVKHAKELLWSLSGSALIREVYSAFHPSGLVHAVIGVCDNALSAIGKDDDEDENDKGGEDQKKRKQQVSIFEDRVGHLAIKNLLLCDVDNEKKKKNDKDQEEEGTSFALEFYSKFKPRLVDVAQSNRGAFVLSALCTVPMTRADVLNVLKKESKKIRKLAEGDGSTAGYESLLNEILKMK